MKGGVPDQRRHWLGSTGHRWLPSAIGQPGGSDAGEDWSFDPRGGRLFLGGLWLGRHAADAGAMAAAGISAIIPVPVALPARLLVIPAPTRRPRGCPVRLLPRLRPHPRRHRRPDPRRLPLAESRGRVDAENVERGYRQRSPHLPPAAGRVLESRTPRRRPRGRDPPRAARRAARHRLQPIDGASLVVIAFERVDVGETRHCVHPHPPRALLGQPVPLVSPHHVFDREITAGEIEPPTVGSHLRVGWRRYEYGRGAGSAQHLLSTWRVAEIDAVRVEHRHQLEDETFAQPPSPGVRVTEQEAEEPVEHVRRGSLARVHAAGEEEDLLVREAAGSGPAVGEEPHALAPAHGEEFDAPASERTHQQLTEIVHARWATSGEAIGGGQGGGRLEQLPGRGG
eukprot:scaffold14004_cov111-Isochrysis_galbana.AAC.8